MNKLIIRTDNESKFLMKEAIPKAIQYEEVHMKGRMVGIRNCVLFVKYDAYSEYNFIVYHTKTAIVVRINKVKKYE
jgi:hypothetical protein